MAAAPGAGPAPRRRLLPSIAHFAAAAAALALASGCLGGGGLLAAYFGRTLVDSAAVVAGGVRTTAPIVRVDVWSEAGDTYRSPIVELETEDGRRIEADLHCVPVACFAEWLNWYGAPTKGHVPVAYPRGAPERVMADTWIGRFGHPAFFVILGSLAAAVGLVASHFGLGLAW